MRALVLLLAIVLLPLRGWMGDAMAMQSMPAPMAVSHHAVAEAAVDVDMAAMPCHGADAQASDAPSNGDAPMTHGDHADCTACQVCHSVALTEFGLSPTVQAVPHSAPQVVAEGFDSAVPQLLHKPPIS